MKRIHLLLATCVITCLAGNIHAADSGSRYSSWQPPANETVQVTGQGDQSDMQKMIDELNQLIDDADKVRAADRRFIEDLRDVVNKYDWPWRNTILEEDFTDGKLQKKSPWKIIAGDFQGRRGLGLYSNIVKQRPVPQPTENGSDRDPTADLLGAILDRALKIEKKEKQPSSTVSNDQTASRASLINRIAIPNAFSLKLDVDVRSQQGRIEVGVFQGKPNGAGYRLVFLPGPAASIEIQHIGSRGRRIIDVVDKINAKGDSVHHLLWTRNKQGNMNIKLNDKTILQLSDRSFKDKFSGVIINNERGEFALQRITIQGG